MSGYNVKHLARTILSSHTYQRQPNERGPLDEPFLFAFPVQRRMTAEQLVDSLFAIADRPFDAGQMAVDIDGARNSDNSLHLGEPTRAWHFSSTSNERDRPSLALPFAEPFVGLMQTFGWRGSRQNPLTVRNTESTVLQPAIVANGVLGRRVSSLSDANGLTSVALDATSLEVLVKRLFQRVLSRGPDAEELSMFAQMLREGFESRVVHDAPPTSPRRLPRDMVSWSNHLNPKSNVIKTQLEAAVRDGEQPTNRLNRDWRVRMVDAIWTLLNSPEFIFVP